MDIQTIMQKLQNRFPNGFKLHFDTHENYPDDFRYTIDLYMNGTWEEKVYMGGLTDLIEQFSD